MDVNIETPKKSGRGGHRAGAGRKPSGSKRGGAHCERVHDPRFPQHVTMRVIPNFLRLREPRFMDALGTVLERYYETEFRICHVSLQHNHLHNMVEADCSEGFVAGMRSYTVNLARAFNAAASSLRIGQVFADRYHSRQIETPRDARNSIAYVLGNWRRHREDFYDGASRAALIDEYSSAASFDGWNGRVDVPADWRLLPVSKPRTPLLAFEWRRFGLIDPEARPGPLW